MRQPDVEQHCGAQAPENVAHVPLHLADGFADDADALGDLLMTALLGELCDRDRINVGGEQQGPDLVVEIARKIGALLVLHRRQLLLQTLVLLLGVLQLLHHLVEAMIEAHQLARASLAHALAIVALADPRERGGQVLQRPDRARQHPVDEGQHERTENGEHAKA